MKVGVVMGSTSDWGVMKATIDILSQFGVEYEIKVLSAHRTPKALETWVSDLRERGFGTVIAAAGGAAHLAGVVAAFTTLPVIGVPIKGSSFEGMDSLLSMVQMPPGIPVAVVSVNGAKNAALLALEILAISDIGIKNKMDDFREEQANKVLSSTLES